MHKSVLLDECLEYLNLKSESIIVDCTLGYGGHSSNILKEIKRGFLFAFDQDDEAIEFSTNRLNKISDNYEIIKSNFENIKEELTKRNVKTVNGILYDIGVSSPQLDESDRGFSYHKDAKLDMRMDKSKEFSAYELINTYEYKAKELLPLSCHRATSAQQVYPIQLRESPRYLYNKCHSRRTKV